jgi:hypothetical protein
VAACSAGGLLAVYNLRVTDAGEPPIEPVLLDLAQFGPSQPLPADTGAVCSPDSLFRQRRHTDAVWQGEVAATLAVWSPRASEELVVACGTTPQRVVFYNYASKQVRFLPSHNRY